MKKQIIFLLSLLLLISLCSSQTSDSRKCESACSLNNSLSLKSISSELLSCKNTCQEYKKACLNASAETRSSCISTCKQLSNGKQKNSCLISCSLNNSENRKQCNSPLCESSCTSKKKENLLSNSISFSNCKSACKNSNSTNLTIDQNTCKSAGGLYSPLCNGPYFDIVCTSAKYCICSGNYNFSCPSTYSCIKNFDIKPVRKDTIPGWKDLLGHDLGSIGLCVKN